MRTTTQIQRCWLDTPEWPKTIVQCSAKCLFLWFSSTLPVSRLCLSPVEPSNTAVQPFIIRLTEPVDARLEMSDDKVGWASCRRFILRLHIATHMKHRVIVFMNPGCRKKSVSLPPEGPARISLSARNSKVFDIGCYRRSKRDSVNICSR